MAEITVFYEGPVVTPTEAKALGLNRYFTGKPCKRGHVAQRYAPNGTCLQCDFLRRQSEAFKTLVKTYEAKRASSPERKAYLLALQRSEKQKAKALANRQTEEARAAKRLYNQSEPFKICRRKYLSTEKGKRARLTAVETRRARKIGAAGRFSASDEKKLRDRQKRCYICGKPFTEDDPSELDHVIPLADPERGTHGAGNIALAHRSCNRHKSNSRTHLI